MAASASDTLQPNTEHACVQRARRGIHLLGKHEWRFAIFWVISSFGQKLKVFAQCLPSSLLVKQGDFLGRNAEEPLGRIF